MNYKKISKEFLDLNSVSIGDSIKITTQDVEYQGVLLDRTIDAEDGYIVIKLENGYNVGVSIADSKLELLSKSEKNEVDISDSNSFFDKDKKTVSVLSTGGTVASVYDNKTGAVHPSFTAEDLIKINSEILDHANIKSKVVLNILSEDINVKHWSEISKSVYDEINEGSEGVVVLHGTDTMHYSAAALSFIIDSPVPIVFTGAQRSSDRPSTDSYLNLINAVGASKSDIAETLICMHSDLNDNSCYIHRGVKTRKMHTTRRDTFRSINSQPLAEFKDGKLLSLNTKNYKKRNSSQLSIKNNLENKVALIKSYPGITEEIIEHYIDKGFKGILIEGTGLGHCPVKMVDVIKRATESNIPVVMSSQCIYGKVNMNVYSTGRNLISAGVISAGDMTPETAYVKLCWALGQSESIEEVKNIITTNIANEFGEKSYINNFLI